MVQHCHIVGRGLYGRATQNKDSRGTVTHNRGLTGWLYRAGTVLNTQDKDCTAQINKQRAIKQMGRTGTTLHHYVGQYGTAP